MRMTESDKDKVRAIVITGEGLMAALQDRSGSVEALQRMAKARKAYEAAKRAALAT